MKKRNFLLVLLLLTPLINFSQVQENEFKKAEVVPSINLDVKRTIHLEEHNKSEEIIIKIEEQTESLELSIATTVFSGKLTIEIYDPNGKKQGAFSVGTQLNIQNAEEVQGNITKFLSEPQPGSWKVKIIPTNASGAIQIGTSTSF